MSTFKPQRMQHVRGLCRAFGYLAVTGLAFSAWSIKTARAEMQQQTLSLGREMMELARASNHAVTPVRFNGQTMYLGSSTTDDPAKAVLDRYEALCKASPGQPAAGWADVEKKNGGAIENAPALATSGLMRAGDDAEGSVVCFVKGDDMKPSTREALSSFAQTGELGALGKLRYVYAKKSPSGRTHILTAWTDQKFNLREMMPEEGKDVPGEDFSEIPRVPSSMRAISAKAEGMPYGINIYKTTEPSTKTLAFYDAELPKLGWSGYDPQLDEVKDGGRGRTFVKEGMVLTIATKLQPEGNFVVLGLAGAGAERLRRDDDLATPRTK